MVLHGGRGVRALPTLSSWKTSSLGVRSDMQVMRFAYALVQGKRRWCDLCKAGAKRASAHA